MYVSSFSNVWIPESTPIWERSVGSVCHLYHFLFVYCGYIVQGGVWDLIVSVPDRCPFQLEPLACKDDIL